jgi:hypothetical protein
VSRTAGRARRDRRRRGDGCAARPTSTATTRGTIRAPPCSASRPPSRSASGCTPPAGRASRCRSRGRCCRPACSASSS